MSSNNDLTQVFDGFEPAQAQDTYAIAPFDDALETKKKTSLPLVIIGLIGELMICVGAVLGLFVVWQVWWTNVEVGSEQEKIVAAAQKEYGEIDTTKIGAPQTSEPPAVGKIGYNGTIGLMHIPRLASKATTAIREGESLDVLASGVFGHYSDTVMPGEAGNFSTAIHRDSYGSRVLHIDELQIGDPIIVETADAWYVYKFTDYEIVNPTDVYVVSSDPYAAREQADPNAAQVSASGKYLTITTCHPPMVSNKRWVVHAQFDHWVARADGIPQELSEDQPVTQVEATGVSIRDAINDALNTLQQSNAPKEEGE